MLLVGTDTELLDLDAGARLAGGAVTALAGTGSEIVALLDRQRVVRIGPDGTETLGELGEADGQSLALLSDGDPVVGLRGAQLVRLRAGSWERMRGFEDVPGWGEWDNPAGPAPDTRSMAAGSGARLFVNIHVGGVWSSEDEGLTWRGAVEPDADVHEVVADDNGRVAVAAAVGCGWSTDGGDTWSWTTDGLHGSYSRGVALDGDSIVLSASTGPFSQRAAVYRARLGERFERCEHGLPEWFPSNVDTGCVAISGDRLAIGTYEGLVYASNDGGASWEPAAKGLDPVRAVQLR